MTQLHKIQAHVASMSELLGIVGAMRSLAGMRVQEAQRALPGIRGYAVSMEEAIGSALLLFPSTEPAEMSPRAQRALILCMAEHGFAGGFNERLMGEAEAHFGPRDALFVIGSRGVAAARERGWRPAWTRPIATRMAAAPEMVRALVAELYRRIARGEIARVDVMFARYAQGGAVAIERSQLLPLDLGALKTARPGQPPLHNLDPLALLEKLIAEYVFALLTEATVESIASENAARFATMDAAHDNVSKKLDELRRSVQQARQAEITTELLELVTGAEALGKE